MFRGFIASLRAPVITVIRDPVRRWDKKHTLPACRVLRRDHLLHFAAMAFAGGVCDPDNTHYTYSASPL